MTERTADTIRQAVSAAYGARAREVAAGNSASCCADDCCSDSRAAGVKEQFYAAEETGSLPASVVSYGCGNPIALAGLHPGEIVLDLGSGAGLDCFLAAQRVGETGLVIGLDMTDDMLSLAEANKAKLGLTNVEFREGVMEAMPLSDRSVDVIISNCVINLSPDKDAVFREALRVLRPGGRLHVSDVVLLGELSAAEQTDLDLWAGCASGALPKDDYAARLRAAGFEQVAIQVQETEVNDAGGAAKPWRNALIHARRPGDEGADLLQVLACDIQERPAGAPSIFDVRTSIQEVRREPDALVVTFSPTATSAVQAFVAAEQQCCRDLQWNLEFEPAPRLRIVATAPQLDALAELFAE
ncbi:MAG: arsenite methyltransferase [Dehalococcoidia bacterium]